LENRGGGGTEYPRRKDHESSKYSTSDKKKSANESSDANRNNGRFEAMHKTNNRPRHEGPYGDCKHCRWGIPIDQKAAISDSDEAVMMARKLEELLAV
jgi:hypothetical protein